VRHARPRSRGQIAGEAEFNEVFLTGVRLGDDLRLGEIGDGRRVAQTTLMNERVAIGGTPPGGAAAEIMLGGPGAYRGALAVLADLPGPA
jgi:alkylation response protein AidB-like acyl-CoA dehydrogenase